MLRPFFFAYCNFIDNSPRLFLKKKGTMVKVRSLNARLQKKEMEKTCVIYAEK